MNQRAVVSKFSHVKPDDTEFTGGGLRDFFLYRDLGIAAATGGEGVCHLGKANPARPPGGGTRWHEQQCAFPTALLTTGRAPLMREANSTPAPPGRGGPTDPRSS